MRAKTSPGAGKLKRYFGKATPSPAPRVQPAGRGKPKYVDLGSGEGELLTKLAGLRKRKLEGVEQPNAMKFWRKVPGARVNYRGFDRWLRTARDNSYDGINAGLFFGNYFYETRNRILPEEEFVSYASSVNPSLGRELRKERYANLKAFRVKVLKKVLATLKPGGRLRRVEIDYSLEDMKGLARIMQEAGFVDVRFRRMRKSELATAWEQKHWKKTDEILAEPMGTDTPLFLYVLTGRKPRR